MGLPAILYNSLIVETGAPRVFRPQIQVPSTVNMTLTGAIETIVVPRVDTQIHMEFPVETSPALIYPIENWFFWAQQGGAWSFAFDRAKVVDTTLTAAAVAGATSIAVASAAGITPGQLYKLINGPFYQIVLVSNVASLTISFATTPLLYPFLSGAIFRDKFFYPGVLPSRTAYPINFSDAGIRTWPAEQPFELVLDFFEKVA